MKKKSVKNNSAGFTVVEVLVALTIFSFAIVGLVTVSAGGLANTSISKNTLTANYLAQEGIELVRNLRDSDVLLYSSAGWNPFINSLNAGQCNTSTGCNIDPLSLTISACSSNGCSIPFDPATGYYGQGPGNSIFTRVIKIGASMKSNGSEIPITSIVTWPQGLTTKTVALTENIFNWNF